MTDELGRNFQGKSVIPAFLDGSWFQGPYLIRRPPKYETTLLQQRTEQQGFTIVLLIIPISRFPKKITKKLCMGFLEREGDTIVV
jgi:hypothetical protein